MPGADEPLIRVMALHALAYCERLFYLEEVEEIRIADARVYAGRTLHEELRQDEEAEDGEWSSVELASERLGIRGFKLLPSYQHFYPNDRALYPFYEYVQSLGMPIMFHTGTSIFHGTRIKYADPLLLDEVADDFPRLNIIMEHGGRTFWYDRAAWLVSKYGNMHIGIAGIATRHLPRFFPRLEQFSDRFVFGSDWPGFADIKGLIDRVCALPYSDETKERILYRNAERLLGRIGRG